MRKIAQQHCQSTWSIAVAASEKMIPSHQNALPVCLLENSHKPVDEWSASMANAVSKFTSGEINRAGKVLSNPNASQPDRSRAIEVMDNWRVAHGHPLEVARKTLKARAQLVSKQATIGTRLKREESIRAKLARERDMKLSTMQDIGGCRVILRDQEEVNQLISLYSHDPAVVRVTDYVAYPRKSGYRGKHIIWRYTAENDDDATFDNMKIELQVRTELQHSWATAIEVASTFSNQNLKSDHTELQDENWVRFFKLMGSVMAIKEGGGLVVETPANRSKLISELGRLADKLKVVELMKRWNTATQITNAAKDTQAHQFLIELQAFEHIRCKVNVTPYAKGRETQAAEDRVRLEIESREKVGVQVVLVSVQSVETLQTAYPNYFSDTTRFVTELEKALFGREDSIRTSTFR